MAENFLFQGDSITDAFRSRSDDDYAGNGYPTLVKAQLGCKYPGKFNFFNRGVSGDRIVDIYARIKSDIINLRPDYMTVLVGINDVWHEISRSNGVDAEKYGRVYDSLISEVREALPEIKIIILEPFVLEGFSTCDCEECPDRLETFRRETALRSREAKRVADKHGLPFVYLQDKFDEACRREAPSYWLYDGVHPSAMGHYIIKEALIECIEKII